MLAIRCDGRFASFFLLLFPKIQVYLTWQTDDTAPTGGHYTAWCSEGGMTEFHAHTDQEWQLRNWLVARDGHATVEHVVSGPGLANTYRFLCESKGVEPVESDDSAPDAALQKTVAEKALAKTDPICEEVQWLRHHSASVTRCARFRQRHRSRNPSYARVVGAV